MERERLSEEFEASRPRLRAVAYRMLGSHEEAADVVQETWLRVEGAGSTEVQNLGGWLTTISTRICLDRLRSRRSRPENAAGIQLDERDERTAEFDEAAGPEEEALLGESIGAALLVVLDRLTPTERVAFVLHDVFAVPFDEIAQIIDRTPEAARQLASRARRRVQGTSPVAGADLLGRRQIVDAFLAAARSGDFESLLAVLDPDVVLRPDDDAVRMGGFAEVRGATAVAGLMRRGGAQAARRALVDGGHGLAWAPGGRVRGAIAFDISEGRIVEIDVIGNRERLERLDVVLLDN